MYNKRSQVEANVFFVLLSSFYSSPDLLLVLLLWLENLLMTNYRDVHFVLVPKLLVMRAGLFLIQFCALRSRNNAPAL